jgi:hypothetical protein
MNHGSEEQARGLPMKHWPVVLGLAEATLAEDTGLACSLDVTVGPDAALYFSTASTVYRWGS